MSPPALTKSVNDFISDRVSSIEQLEVLCLLHAEPGEAWSVQSIADAVHIAESQAAGALAHLEAQKLVVAGGLQHGSYRYAPATTELAAQASEAISAYARSRVEVLMLISRCAMDRIRNAQVRTFAQAFLLRGPKKDDRS
jgi:DNA-binding IclR family transcriptional regulator